MHVWELYSSLVSDPTSLYLTCPNLTFYFIRYAKNGPFLTSDINSSTSTNYFHNKILIWGRVAFYDVPFFVVAILRVYFIRYAKNRSFWTSSTISCSSTNYFHNIILISGRVGFYDVPFFVVAILRVYLIRYPKNRSFWTSDNTYGTNTNHFHNKILIWGRVGFYDVPFIFVAILRFTSKGTLKIGLFGHLTPLTVPIPTTCIIKFES